MPTEKQKFIAWLELEQAKGLTRFHITPNAMKIMVADISEEEVYKQLNEMNAAVDAGLAIPLTGL